MDLVKLLDTVLQYFADNYPKRQNYSLDQVEKNIIISFPELEKELNDSQLYYILIKLSDDGFIEIDSRDSGHGSIFGGTVYNYYYSIKLQGVYFIKFKGGYSKQLLVQEQRETLELEAVKANVATSNSVKETNEPIRVLNNKTKDFYNFQRKMAIFIAIATLVSAFGTVAPFFKDSKRNELYLQDTLQIMQKKVKQLDSTLQYQILHQHLTEIKKTDSLTHP